MYKTFEEYESVGGSRPVRDWYQDLDEDVQAFIDSKLDYLCQTKSLFEKFAKVISGHEGLWEIVLTFKKNEYRLLCCDHPSSEDVCVMLSGHHKKSWKLKKTDFKVANERKEEISDDEKRSQAREW